MTASQSLSPLPSALRVAVVQLTSNEDLGHNTSVVIGAICDLAAQGFDLILFPENALFLRASQSVGVPGLSLTDVPIQQIQAAVDNAGCAVHLGSIPLQDGDKLKNSTLVLRPGERPKALYHKIHLFDVDLIGQKPMRESDAFTHGKDPAYWEFRGFKFGLSICYDIRFSELYRMYAQAQVDAILIPAAFTVPTGKAHWHILLRARAIEAQAYVLAAAQGGRHVSQDGKNTRETYGHTLAVDPWGVVIGEIRDLSDPSAANPASDGSQFFGEGYRALGVELSKDRIAAVRAQIPMSSHRRLC